MSKPDLNPLITAYRFTRVPQAAQQRGQLYRKEMQVCTWWADATEESILCDVRPLRRVGGASHYAIFFGIIISTIPRACVVVTCVRTRQLSLLWYGTDAAWEDCLGGSVVRVDAVICRVTADSWSRESTRALIKWQSGQKYPLELYLYNCSSNHSDSISSGRIRTVTILEMNHILKKRIPE